MDAIEPMSAEAITSTQPTPLPETPDATEISQRVEFDDDAPGCIALIFD